MNWRAGRQVLPREIAEILKPVPLFSPRAINATGIQVMAKRQPLDIGQARFRRSLALERPAVLSIQFVPIPIPG